MKRCLYHQEILCLDIEIAGYTLQLAGMQASERNVALLESIIANLGQLRICAEQDATGVPT